MMKAQAHVSVALEELAAALARLPGEDLKKVLWWTGEAIVKESVRVSGAAQSARTETARSLYAAGDKCGRWPASE